MSPIWFVFEGIDGCGKTTQANLLNDYLNRNGIHSLYKHVFDTRPGILIRHLFLNNDFLSNTVEALLLCASRQAFLDELCDAVTDYDVIIVDRFFLSILAMQGVCEKDVNLVKYVRSNVCDIHGEIYLFYISTDTIEAKRRLNQRDVGKDRIEKMSNDFHEEVQKRYYTFLEQEKNVLYIDGNQDVLKVHKDIVLMSQKCLSRHIRIDSINWKNMS